MHKEDNFHASGLFRRLFPRLRENQMGCENKLKGALILGLVPVINNVHSKLHSMKTLKDVKNQAVYGKEWDDWRFSYYADIAKNAP